jgi:hypothetical protein
MRKCAAVRQCFRIAVSDKFENDVPCGMERRFYQGLLYFQIVARLRGTRECNCIYASKNSTAFRTVRPSLRQLAQNPEMQYVTMCTFVTLNFKQIRQQVWRMRTAGQSQRRAECDLRCSSLQDLRSCWRRGETPLYRICMSVS